MLDSGTAALTVLCAGGASLGMLSQRAAIGVEIMTRIAGIRGGQGRALLFLIVVLLVRWTWSQNKAEQRYEKVEGEHIELLVEPRLAEGVPFGLEQINNNAVQQLQMLQLVAKDNEVQHGILVNVPCLLVDGVDHEQRVGGTGDASQLPIDLPFDAHHMEEHLDAAQLGCQCQWGQVLYVLYVYIGAHLIAHIEHFHLLVDDQHMEYGIAVCVLEVRICTTRQHQAKAFLLWWHVESME